jgi:hypothetical protein
MAVLFTFTVVHGSDGLRMLQSTRTSIDPIMCYWQRDTDRWRLRDDGNPPTPKSIFFVNHVHKRRHAKRHLIRHFENQNTKQYTTKKTKLF